MNQQTVPQDIEPHEGQEIASQDVQQEGSQPAGAGDGADGALDEVALAMAQGVAMGVERDAGTRMVPVSEAKRYRQRAQAAEATLAELQAQLATNQEEIRKSQALIENLERRQHIDELLVEHETLDLEAARLLVEQVIARDEGSEVAAAVAEVQRRTPMLFRRRQAESAALAARHVNSQSSRQESLVRAASEASATGQRHDVLRYLRLRRRP